VGVKNLVSLKCRVEDLSWHADVVISPAQLSNNTRRLTIAPRIRWPSLASLFELPDFAEQAD